MCEVPGCSNALDRQKRYCSLSCSAKGTKSWTYKIEGPRRTWTCRYCGEEHRRQNVAFCSPEHKFQWGKENFIHRLESGAYSGSSSVRGQLYKYGLKQPKCEWCGITEWRGQPAPLTLDHVNGDATDNRLVNLRILCANCHSQTPTFCGRNKGNGRRSRPYTTIAEQKAK